MHIFLLLPLIFGFCQSTIVEISTGKIRGYTRQSSHNATEYFTFLGIPYAKPPTGDLRFRDPIAAEKWSGIRNATDFGLRCVQSILGRFSIGNEDCLYLNVYTKQIHPKELLPVMVWIHGGAFAIDSADTYGADHFMLPENDIVLVTFNYRLGIFGFLNLELEDAPGNQGLKDQVLALSWVQTNIKEFGGDPKQVTIFGESAGAASVHYMVGSQSARGLFSKAILQSGSALNPWSIGPKQDNAIKKVAKTLQCESENPREIIKCFRQADVDKISGAQRDIMPREINRTLDLPFGPGIDSMAKKPFLPIPIEESLKNSTSIPILIGYNSEEGVIFMPQDQNLSAAWEEFKNANDPRISSIYKRYNITMDDMKRIYSSNGTISDKNFTNYVTDVCFLEGINRAIVYEIERNNTGVYLYRFDYMPTLAISRFVAYVDFKGPGHIDEIPFLFKMSYLVNVGEASRDFKILLRMIGMWKNFAYTGNPTPTTSDLLPIKALTSTNASSLNYLIIDEEMKRVTLSNIREKLLSFRGK